MDDGRNLNRQLLKMDLLLLGKIIALGIYWDVA
jgi:hypothetical protein